MYGTCRRKPVLDECFKTPFQLTYALFLILYRCSTVTARTGRLFVTLTLTWMERQTESNQGTPTVCGSQEWRPQDPQQDIQVCLSVCMSVCVCLSVCVCQPSQSCGVRFLCHLKSFMFFFISIGICEIETPGCLSKMADICPAPTTP